MYDLTWIIFCVCFIGGLSIFAVFCFVKGIKQYKQQKENKRDSNAREKNELIEQEFKTVEVNATVIDQSCSVKMVGIKTPKTVKEFIIVFKTDDGKLLKLPVPEEMYDGFIIDQKGLLTMVDGELYSFVPKSIL